MGTDIHGVFQRHLPAAGTWETVPTHYKEERHYQLFAVLADVRNGYGFAGVVTGEAVKPIAMPRGLPADFDLIGGDAHPVACLELMGRRAEYHEAGEPLEVWMGDHSYSWLTGAEILAWAAKAPVVLQQGVLSREQYAAWDKKTEPPNYCGGIMGKGILVVQDDDVSRSNPKWTHVSCHWEQSLADELKYFFDEVRRLQAEHGEVRFVFGFDS